MKKITSITLFSAIALACGSGDSGTTSKDASSDVAAPSAARVVEEVETGRTAEAAKEAEAAQAPALDQNAVTCLELVREKRYVEAMTPCTLAVQNAPDNEEVVAALGSAKAAAQQQAAASAQAAVDGASDAASDAAAGAIDQGAKSLTDQPH